MIIDGLFGIILLIISMFSIIVLCLFYLLIKSAVKNGVKQAYYEIQEELE